MQEADVVRNLILAAPFLLLLAACGSPDTYPVSGDGASSHPAGPCAAGCQPGSVEIRMNMTAGEMLFDRR